MRHLVIAWLAVTTALLAVTEFLWPSRAIALAGILGALLLFLAIEETRRKDKIKEVPQKAPETPQEPPPESFQKRDFEEF